MFIGLAASPTRRARNLLPLLLLWLDRVDDSQGECAMNLKPLGDRIVVRREEAEEKTSGGIVLPDSAKNKPQRGTVLAVGTGKMLKDGTRRPLQVRKGDKVLFTSWAGDEFKGRVTGQEVLLMREEDVLAVVDA